MDKKYNCSVCNFATAKLSNFKRHQKTKKHLAKIEGLIKDSKKTQSGLTMSPDKIVKIKEILCRKCGKVQSSYSNRKRHESICTGFNLAEENKKLKEELKETKQKLSSMFNPTDLVSFMTNNNDVITQPVHIHQHISNNTSNVTNNYGNKKTVNISGFRYAKENYNQAPLLIHQGNFTSRLLFGITAGLNKTPKLELTNGNKNKNDDNYTDNESEIEIIPEDEESTDEFEIEDLEEEENIKFVDNVSHYKKEDKLVKVYTNFIIRYYKKEKKEEQALHVVDAARQKFIYTKLEKGLNKIKWVEDPKGYNVGRIIIIPIINYTIHQVELYQKRLSNKVLSLNKQGKFKEMGTYSERLANTTNLSLYLNKHKDEIKKAVIVEISPAFHIGDIIIKD